MTIEGSVSIEGDDATLSSASVLSAPTYGSTSFTFFFSAITGGCEELQTISFNVSVQDGESIDGTYDFANFYEGVIGNIAIQNVATSDVLSSDFETGTVMITENSEDNFTLDIDAVTADGVAVSVNVTAEF